MQFQTFPQVVGVALGDAAALAILSRGNGREFFFAAGQDTAVAFLQFFVLSWRQFLALALCDEDACVVEQPFHVGSPSVAVGIHQESQLPQQVRAAQAVAAMPVGKVGGPAVMDDHSAVAGDHPDGIDRLVASLWMQELVFACLH